MSTTPKSLWEAVTAAGFSKLGWIAAAFAVWFLGITPLGIPLGWCFVAIAVYVNANPIWKYILKGWNTKL